MPKKKTETGDTLVPSNDDEVTTVAAATDQAPEEAIADAPQDAPQDALDGAESSVVGESASAALPVEPVPAPVVVVRVERHHGATDVFGYHLVLPNGGMDIEYLSDGRVRSADGAHPLDASVFALTPAASEE